MGNIVRSSIIFIVKSDICPRLINVISCPENEDGGGGGDCVELKVRSQVANLLQGLRFSHLDPGSPFLTTFRSLLSKAIHVPVRAFHPGGIDSFKRDIFVAHEEFARFLGTIRQVFGWSG
ncbi:hypothetical protein Nepgr_019814 [Nepenthes gracilis]|uniref:Uncharacterized protein n=1 Tax=Nepenthes gracilis TaxID=150966 RepID=A0AAD3SU35_NEPGR|nr:hypothetical protein Nepgr_019814 [Nepenthes gracilis]